MGASLLVLVRRWLGRPPAPAPPRWARIGEGLAVRDMTAEERRGWLTGGSATNAAGWIAAIPRIRTHTPTRS